MQSNMQPKHISTAADAAALVSSWSVGDASSSSPPLGYQDALDEALIAVEQVVIPRQQPIELLPRTAELLDMQVRCWHLLSTNLMSFVHYLWFAYKAK